MAGRHARAKACTNSSSTNEHRLVQAERFLFLKHFLLADGSAGKVISPYLSMTHITRSTIHQRTHHTSSTKSHQKKETCDERFLPVRAPTTPISSHTPCMNKAALKIRWQKSFNECFHPFRPKQFMTPAGVVRWVPSGRYTFKP